MDLPAGSDCYVIDRWRTTSVNASQRVCIQTIPQESGDKLAALESGWRFASPQYELVVVSGDARAKRCHAATITFTLRGTV